jgi:lipoprotein-releasing system ATP-binding protein
MNNSNQVVLSCTNLHKSYVQGESKLNILDGINLKVSPGETVSIVGSSGSGKSTLLHLLAGLAKPSLGDIVVADTPLQDLNDSEVCLLRNKYLGFVYQFHHLLPEFTALENVLMPLIINIANNNTQSKDKQDKTYKSSQLISEEQHVKDLLKRLGLGKRLYHYPSQLSGGERQRLAIARAIVNNPKIIFADEPTGNLDNATAGEVLKIFFELQAELNTSLVMVTHDRELAKLTQTCYNLHDGKLKIDSI